MLPNLEAATREAELTRRIGTVRQVAGLAIESRGPDVAMGEVCTVASRHGERRVQAEVVAIRDGIVTLMLHGSIEGLAVGSEVQALGEQPSIHAGSALLGRVIDPFGRALDGRADPICHERRPLRAPASNPMRRPRIERALETGVRCIDSLLTLGQGQRVGIFAGSGVGKSTLLGMIARHVRADVNVIALVGERGREVREFVEKQLGTEGLARSIVVVATSDQPPLVRLRAAYAAVSIAEWLRDEGRQVLLTMDSITRLAMARREVGLSAGEPPTARGYTPSVFAELPELCERCGTSASGGSITALFTVLVEGDDLNEPISDCLRATLDGHIVLSRQLAHEGHYPAIDVLRSASRVMPDVVTPAQWALAARTTRQLALLERHRQMVDLGAYVAGSNPALDHALSVDSALREFLRQSDGGAAAAQALQMLDQIVEATP
jgi:flagellum-specific ATP synthase